MAKIKKRDYLIYGEILEYKGEKFRAIEVKVNECAGCYFMKFHNITHCPPNRRCKYYSRDWKTNIIYKKYIDMKDKQIKEYINDKLHNSAVLKEVIGTIAEHFESEFESLENEVRKLKRQLAEMNNKNEE